jgi:hypothetical protein
VGRNGKWLQTDGRHLLTSAIKSCLVDHKVFGTVKNVGVKHLEDKGVVGTIVAATIHIQRHSGKALKRAHLGIKHFEALPTETRTQHNLHVTVLALTHDATKSKSLQKMEAKVKDAALPLAKALMALAEVL